MPYQSVQEYLSGLLMTCLELVNTKALQDLIHKFSEQLWVSRPIYSLPFYPVSGFLHSFEYFKLHFSIECIITCAQLAEISINGQPSKCTTSLK